MGGKKHARRDAAFSELALIKESVSSEKYIVLLLTKRRRVKFSQKVYFVNRMKNRIKLTCILTD